ncbi:hypothetical protein A3Q56_03386 [Intoshia linei]|uniref:FPL domain-containing protein n=1 Tax=Intoshia linei TaxID=1819745 RepID=A0A177B5H6_9BILA|nr:hypothetical protein A3Q56_03386 [Intoshia linei]
MKKFIDTFRLNENEYNQNVFAKYYNFKETNFYSFDNLKFTFDTIIRQENKQTRIRPKHDCELVVIEGLRRLSLLTIWADSTDNSEEIFEYLNTTETFVKCLPLIWNRSICVQYLQTLNIIYENIKKPTSFYSLISKNKINTIITNPFDLYDDEILAYYFSLLKILSIRMSKATYNFFTNKSLEKIQIPIYTIVMDFINHYDKMIIISAQNIILNMIKIDQKSFIDFLKESNFYNVIIEILLTLCKKILTLLINEKCQNATIVGNFVNKFIELCEFIAEICNINDSVNVLMDEKVWKVFFVKFIISPPETLENVECLENCDLANSKNCCFNHKILSNNIRRENAFKLYFAVLFFQIMKNFNCDKLLDTFDSIFNVDDECLDQILQNVENVNIIPPCYSALLENEKMELNKCDSSHQIRTHSLWFCEWLHDKMHTETTETFFIFLLLSHLINLKSLLSKQNKNDAILRKYLNFLYTVVHITTLNIITARSHLNNLIIHLFGCIVADFFNLSFDSFNCLADIENNLTNYLTKPKETKLRGDNFKSLSDKTFQNVLSVIIINKIHSSLVKILSNLQNLFNKYPTFVTIYYKVCHNNEFWRLKTLQDFKYIQVRNLRNFDITSFKTKSQSGYIKSQINAYLFLSNLLNIILSTFTNMYNQVFDFESEIPKLFVPPLKVLQELRIGETIDFSKYRMVCCDICWLVKPEMTKPQEIIGHFLVCHDDCILIIKPAQNSKLGYGIILYKLPYKHLKMKLDFDPDIILLNFPQLQDDSYNDVDNDLYSQIRSFHVTMFSNTKIIKIKNVDKYGKTYLIALVFQNNQSRNLAYDNIKKNIEKYVRKRTLLICKQLFPKIDNPDSLNRLVECSAYYFNVLDAI